MDKVNWVNPNSGERYIHLESEGRKELLYGILDNQGQDHNHAVWNNNKLSYLRENGFTKADDKLP